MVIDIKNRRPLLSSTYGGLSGPAIKPVMIRSVYDIYEAVKIPIIATGGITTGEDAIEAIMAGAAAVGIGTAIYYRGVEVFAKVTQEIGGWLEDHRLSLPTIRGCAHELV